MKTGSYESMLKRILQSGIKGENVKNCDKKHFDQVMAHMRELIRESVAHQAPPQKSRLRGF